MFTLSGVSVVNAGDGQTDVFVLQLKLDPSLLSSGSELGWLDTGTNEWTNAVNGNFSGTATFISGAYDSTTDNQLGDYGVDLANGTVWAVLDHNSSFAIIAVPEPATWFLLALSLSLLILCSRNTKRHQAKVFNR